jgi:hypothetical protein
MTTRSAFLPLLAAAMLAACTTTGAVMLGGSGTYPELPPGEVRVFLREQDVPGDYERIALVTARSDAAWADEATLIRALRRRAARLGADGLILGEIRDPSTVERIAEVLTDYQPQRRGRAVAIRLVDGHDHGHHHH